MIHVMQADGSNLFAIADPEGVVTYHVWSDDDALIACQSDLDGDLDIYVYEGASEKTRLMTDGALPSPAKNK